MNADADKDAVPGGAERRFVESMRVMNADADKAAAPGGAARRLVEADAGHER